MKRIKFVYAFIIYLSFALHLPVTAQNDTTDTFSFLFMTDIHLQPESGATDGFKMAIDTANKLDADFVLTGGDLIMDALGVSFNRADSLYQLYVETTKNFNIPVYNTIGNHELFGIYKKR